MKEATTLFSLYLREQLYHFSLLHYAIKFNVGIFV